MRLRVAPVTAAMRSPWVTSRGTVTARRLLHVTLTAADGLTGHGEAAPLPDYDGVTEQDVHAALEDCRAPLEAADEPAGAVERVALLDECERGAVLPQALAAVDLALWDLAGRRTRTPAWRLLGAEQPASVPVNATITTTDRAGAARASADARSQGMTCVKLKVGTGDDAGRIAAVRAAVGPSVAIRLDANGAWDVEEAIRWLEVLAPAGIELCEEPVSGVAAIERVAAASSVPVAIDESAADPAAFSARRCTALCLKISRCGGITGLLRTGQRARELGYELYLASTLDGPLGIAAALHAAAVLPPDRPCGLATLGVFASHVDPDLFHRPAEMLPPPGPGLGDGLAEWYA